MFHRSILELSQAGAAGKLVLDYLSAKPELRHFYSHPPVPAGFSALLAEKPYRDLDRKTVCEVLQQQAASVKNTNKKTLENIASISGADSFTVTTGHQLCLFTGPLYFIYKIATTINLAQRLNDASKGKHTVVPVFWMASEDHDFEEINHFVTAAGKVTWETAQRGAVGRFDTKELQKMSAKARGLFGNSDNGTYLSDLFDEAYARHQTLSAATRFLVNELFGEQGIVVIDADDRLLKAQFADEMRKDLFDEIAFAAIKKSTDELASLGYDIQVNPRRTNLFLLDRDRRARLDKKEDGTFVAGSDTFSVAEMDTILQSEPERLSPNVSLRGLYQQKILPNLAYVGGAGELSYWLEYKRLFDVCGIQFPILVPRNTFTILDEENAARMRRYNLQPADLFRSYKELAHGVLSAKGETSDAEDEKRSISKVYDQLRAKAAETDKTLLRHVNALEQKHLKNIDGFVQKMERSLLKKSETELQRLRTAQQFVKPGDVLQERYYNFSVFYTIYGRAFIDEILKEADPFVHQHIILQHQDTLA